MLLGCFYFPLERVLLFSSSTDSSNIDDLHFFIVLFQCLQIQRLLFGPQHRRSKATQKAVEMLARYSHEFCVIVENAARVSLV